MQKNTLAISIGVISTFILGIFLTSYLNIPNHLTGEGNGFMSYGSWLTYFLCGVIVGFIAKKAPIATAIISGITTWFIFALIELSDWQYYFGIAKNRMPFQTEGYIYFLKLAVTMSILFAIGGFIGKLSQAFFTENTKQGK